MAIVFLIMNVNQIRGYFSFYYNLMMFWAKIVGFYIVFVLWIIYAEMIFVNEDSVTTFFEAKDAQFAIEQKSA